MSEALRPAGIIGVATMALIVFAENHVEVA